VGTASAQRNVTIGAKAGLNVVRMQNNHSNDERFRPTFHLGLFGHVKLGENLALQPELLYSAQGTRLINNLHCSMEDNRSVRSSYLQVPLMLQYAFMKKIIVEAGPQIGILLSAYRKSDGYWEEGGGDGEYIYYPEPGSDDIKDFFTTTDVGIGVGVGYRISKRIGLNSRFTQGLNNLLKSTYRSTGEKEKSQVIAVGLSFSF